MRAGALRNVIDIEQQSETGRNALNEPIVSWTLWRQVYCEKFARRGAERYDDGTSQRYAEAVFRFRCRYQDVEGIDATMRIVFEGQVYDIRAILPDDQRREDCIIDATLQNGSA
jgi:SPP1 family predicted phage head-tail adaptor